MSAPQTLSLATLEPPAMDAEEMIDGFELLDDWEDRYAFLMDMGRQMPRLPEDAKRPELKVNGCVSQVWLMGTLLEDDEPRLRFLADSDAALVRGLIAVLRVIYDGRSPAEVADIDVEGIFRRLGLAEHLTPNRRNGFFAIVERLKALAATGA